MAALAICAVTAALLRRRTDTQAPAPVHPDQAPPPDPGMIPLTVPETGRLLAARPRPAAPGTGGAATRPAHAGTTSEHASPALPGSRQGSGEAAGSARPAALRHQRPDIPGYPGTGGSGGMSL
jgi:hypothetical protein